MQWTASPRGQEAIIKLDELLNFREIGLAHIDNPDEEFHQLIDGDYKVSPTSKQIFEIQTKLRQPLMDIIRNHEISNTKL